MTDERIKVLTVDDERLAREYIRGLLKSEPDIEIVGESGNGRDAARAIIEKSPDLVFLDVQMPGMDGLSMLKTVDLERLPLIIFTTAYEEYAIRAFEFHALDYLLKPFDPPRFKRALDYARDRLREPQQVENESAQIAELLKSLAEKPRHLERLLIKMNGRIVFLQTKEIDWIRSDDKYVHLNFGKQSHLVRQSLSALKAQLDPETFVQINRSVIVNAERIKELQPMFSGEYVVLMRDGTELTLSRNYKNALFDLLGKPL